MKTKGTNVKHKKGLLIVNFGGPRDLSEIPAFLKELLCDQDVLMTPLPGWLHRAIFSCVALKRATKVQADYDSIGGRSPIYATTESLKKQLEKKLNMPIFTFHRYLPKTHRHFLQNMITANVNEWTIFPLFPQFSYTTTGSIARWMQKKLPSEITNSFSWVKSYGHQNFFIQLFANRIRSFIQKMHSPLKDWVLFFSAHGLPHRYVLSGDPYQRECQQSYELIMQNFPECKSILAYQSKFGPGEWIRPYTMDVCQHFEKIAPKNKKVLFIPLAFTSDHIETLFEIETEYMPVLQKKSYSVFRLPAFNDEKDWVDAIEKILTHETLRLNNAMMIR